MQADSAAEPVSRRPARRSPPTERVIALLDFLTSGRGERFGLSELARELGISKPTCLGIVTELTECGYLVRDPKTLTYGLGPALIAAGRVAQNGFAMAGVAQTHLERLSATYGTTCTASAVVNERIMVLANTGPDTTAKVGQTYPFAPPVGLMYVLWGPDAALDAWLAKEPTLPVRLDADYLRQVVDECRARGYLVERLTVAGSRLHSVMAGVAAYDLPAEVRELVGELVSSLGERVYLGTDITPRSKHQVNLIAAPTFDADGRQDMVLTLHAGTAITGAEIARRGAALRAAAKAVTAAAGAPSATSWRARSNGSR